jgi:hypothetical protein
MMVGEQKHSSHLRQRRIKASSGISKGILRKNNAYEVGLGGQAIR